MEDLVRQYAKNLVMKEGVSIALGIAERRKSVLAVIYPSTKAKIYTKEDLTPILNKIIDDILELDRHFKKILDVEEQSLSAEDKKMRDYLKKNN
jgi:hypothetical protein